MPSSNVPIACNLSALSATERAQRATLATRLRADAQEVIETKSGYKIRLPEKPSAYRDAFELALLERRCCPFLQLTFKLECGNGPVWFLLGGGPQVKEFLSTTDLVGCADQNCDEVTGNRN